MPEHSRAWLSSSVIHEVAPVDLIAELDEQLINLCFDATVQIYNNDEKIVLSLIRTVFVDYGYEVHMFAATGDALQSVLARSINSNDKSVSKIGLDLALAILEADSMIIPPSSILHDYFRSLEANAAN